MCLAGALEPYDHLAAFAQYLLHAVKHRKELEADTSKKLANAVHSMMAKTATNQDTSTNVGELFTADDVMLEDLQREEEEEEEDDFSERSIDRSQSSLAGPGYSRSGGEERSRDLTSSEIRKALKEKSIILERARKRQAIQPERLLQCFSVMHDEFIVIVSSSRLLVVETAAAKLPPDEEVKDNLVRVNNPLTQIIDIVDDGPAVQFTFLHEKGEIKYARFMTNDIIEGAIARVRLANYFSDSTLVQANYGSQAVWRDVTAELSSQLANVRPPGIRDQRYDWLGKTTLRPSPYIPALVPYEGYKEDKDEWYNKLLSQDKFLKYKPKALLVTFVRGNHVYQRIFVDGQAIVLF